MILQEAIRLHLAGNRQEAERLYREILSQNSTCFDALHNLGVLRAELGFIEEGIQFLSKALLFRPDSVDGVKNITKLFFQQGRGGDAVQSWKHCFHRRPHDPSFVLDYGCFLHLRHSFEEAIAIYQHLLELVPEQRDALCNIGLAFADLGQYEKGIKWLSRAIELYPDHVAAYANRSLLFLLLERYEEGWTDYAACRIIMGLPQKYASLKTPSWKGEDVWGKTILMIEEQGIGDSLQFFRYIPLIQARGAQVVLLCRPSLQKLLSSQFNASESAGMTVKSIEEEIPLHDVHFFMMDAPLVFGKELNDIPQQIPYIIPPAKEKEDWNQRLTSFTTEGTYRVGLTWAGNPEHRNDLRRSIPPTCLTPLKELDHCVFFSLQKSESYPSLLPFAMEDYTQEFTDLAQTAAFLSHLDLVITVDTSIAHLAGAMGKEVWILLPFVPDWRWRLHRRDTPWYPTARLFRQRESGDWKCVIEEVRHALLLKEG